MLSKETKGNESLYIRDCSEAYYDEEFKCTTQGEQNTIKTCNCKTELCNKNWADAGDTQDPTVKCYSCNSESGDCDEVTAGVEVDCPKDHGCSITREKTIFVRGCSDLSTVGCKEEGDLKYCNCQTELCNKDW